MSCVSCFDNICTCGKEIKRLKELVQLTENELFEEKEKRKILERKVERMRVHRV